MNLKELLWFLDKYFGYVETKNMSVRIKGKEDILLQWINENPNVSKEEIRRKGKHGSFLAENKSLAIWK